MEVKRLLQKGDIVYTKGVDYVVSSVVDQKIVNGVLEASIETESGDWVSFNSSEEGSSINYSRVVDYTKVVSDFTEIEEIVHEVYTLFTGDSNYIPFYGDVIIFRVINGDSIEISVRGGILPIKNSYKGVGYDLVPMTFSMDSSMLSQGLVDWVSSQTMVGNLERIEIHIGNSKERFVEEVSALVSGTDDSGEFKKFLQIGYKTLIGRSELLSSIEEEDNPLCKSAIMYYIQILRGLLKRFSFYDGCEGLVEDFYNPVGGDSNFSVVSYLGESSEYYEVVLDFLYKGKNFYFKGLFDRNFCCRGLEMPNYFDITKTAAGTYFVNMLEWFEKLPYSVSSLKICLKEGYLRQELLGGSSCTKSFVEDGCLDIVISN